MPAEAAANVMNIIFFFSILFIWLLICAGFSCTGENRPGNACTGKAVLGQKASEAGNLGRYIAGRVSRRCDVNAPKQGRRGDRGSVR